MALTKKAMKKTVKAAPMKKTLKAKKTMKVAKAKKLATGTMGLIVCKLSPTGQHLTQGPGCISTELNGNPCPHPRAVAHLPYCSQCLKTGDPSLKVVKHPKFGKCLIALRDLKKGYKTAWWGDRLNRKEMKTKDWEWALESKLGVINAVPHRKSSMMQFCQCSGPSEKPTIDYSKDFDCLLAKEDKAGLLFGTLCDIPKNHQLTMMYNKDEKTTNEFFEERGLVRADVACPNYPALKKAGRK